MGCSSSKEPRENATRMAPIVVTRKHAPIMVPQTYRDPQGRPIRSPALDLDRTTLLHAFEEMAASLAQQHLTAQVVTVGGAVNTVYLQSRQKTHDVDFFLADPTSQENTILGEVAKTINRNRNGGLGVEWFNNSTQLMMKKAVQKELFEKAIQQNAIVFQRVSQQGGLVVCAAPWEYALCGKLSRMTTPLRREYDVLDGAVYLREFLKLHQRRTIRLNEIRAWCHKYSAQLNEEVVRELEQNYVERFGKRCVDWNN